MQSEEAPVTQTEHNIKMTLKYIMTGQKMTFKPGNSHMRYFYILAVKKYKLLYNIALYGYCFLFQ